MKNLHYRSSLDCLARELASKKTFPYKTLGFGSSRRVIDLPYSYRGVPLVAKIALQSPYHTYTSGEGQNSLECLISLLNLSYINNVLAHSCCNKIIICRKANPIKYFSKKIIEKLKIKKHEDGSLYVSHHMYKPLMDFSSTFYINGKKSLSSDVIRATSWGYVGNSIKLIDYGFFGRELC